MLATHAILAYYFHMSATSIKNARQDAELTQAQAATILGIPLRTYIRYEQEYPGSNEIKKQYIIDKLSSLSEITEEKGILSIDRIKRIVSEVCESYNISLCYLFGSYAKGKATEKSDVDLLVVTDMTGLNYFGVVEEFREKLHKKVDLLRLEDAGSNKDLLFEILKDGVKIYG